MFLLSRISKGFAHVLFGSFALFLILALAEPAVAGSTEDVVTLDELIRSGLRDSPRLNAAMLEWKRTVERYPQARALADPQLTYTQPIEKIETRLGPVERSLMLSQKIPFPGKLGVKGRIAATDAKVALLAYEAKARDLVLDIKKAYYELYYLDSALALARERINVFEHFTRAEMNDYSVGVSGFNDVLSAETRYADAEYHLILTEERRRAAETRINTLLNRDPEYSIRSVAEPVVEEEKTDLEAFYGMAAQNESLRSAELKVERGALGKKLAGFSYRPDFKLGVNYTQVGDAIKAGLAGSGRDSVAVTFGINIPIWRGKLRAHNREASLAHQRSIRERAAVVNDLSNRIKKAYADMKSDYKLVSLYSETLIPKASNLIGVAEIKYKNGKGSIADLFEAQTMWIKFRLVYHRAVADYLKDRAALERLTAAFEPGLKAAD